MISRRVLLVLAVMLVAPSTGFARRQPPPPAANPDSGALDRECFELDPPRQAGEGRPAPVVLCVEPSTISLVASGIEIARFQVRLRHQAQCSGRCNRNVYELDGGGSALALTFTFNGVRNRTTGAQDGTIRIAGALHRYRSTLSPAMIRWLSRPASEPASPNL